YAYCSKKGIHVIATSPVFSKPVAEIALGMTLSLLRNIHNAHFDFVKPALLDAGGLIYFSGVAIKPGKPVSFGRVGDALWLGLPGNPVAALVTWTIFGEKLFASLVGSHRGTKRRNVVLLDPVQNRGGRCELRLARLGDFDETGREVVTCPAATHSARVAGLIDADGLILIPAETDSIPRGGLVEFLPFAVNN
ncbi:molybdopterin-binding protein, partial [Marivivens sp.]|uniref:molybdopterin-binding protein n=1 Tax=Marivivens sp. TaxID=1978374 RepID=UPI00345B603E